MTFLPTAIRGAALAALATAPAAHAIDFKPAEGVDARLATTVTFGTMIRTDRPDPQDYALIPSSTQANTSTGGLLGQTGGSDLNFWRDHPVSTPLKLVSDLDVHTARLGAFVRASAWMDFTLGHADASYGNYANGYAAGTPLGDRGFARSAKFDGTEVRDAYVYGNATPSEGTRLDARVGRQVLSWGTAALVAGGVNSAINPLDLAAQVRPGSLPAEAKVPLGLVDLKVSIGKAWSVEGFVPFESRESVLPGCGTFFDIASLAAQGCLLTGALSAPIPGTPVATLASLTEKSLLQNGYYVHRAADRRADAGGQYGLALRFDAASIGTQFAAYAMDTHASQPYFAITVEDVNGGTLPPGLAGGLARLASPGGMTYSVAYPKGVHLYALSFDTTLDPTLHVTGELARRPDAPIGLNANDLLAAFLLRAPTSVLQQAHGVLALPAGSTYDGWDRYGVTTADLGTTQAWAHVLGAERVMLAAEVGASHVSGLPDPSVLRYGRPLAYGTAPYLVNGTMTPCSEAVPGMSGVTGKTCTYDGFVSSDAWGLRLRTAATWNDVVLGAALTPSLYVAQDLRGYSYDGTFSQGRRTIRAGLRADWGRTWFGEVAFTGFSGGRYNLLSDRSNVTMVAGVAF